MSTTLPLTSRRGLVLGVSAENSVGFQIARSLRALGANVAISHRPDRREECAALCRSADLGPALEIDFEDDTAIESGFAALAARWDRLDFLVHAIVRVAPASLGRPLLAATRADFAVTMDASAWSLVAACRAAAPLLARSESPRVVTLTSAGSSRAMSGYHLAGIAKAALEAAVRYLAFELGPTGVLVNAVSFSLIETDGARRAIGTERAAAARSQAAKRALTRQAVEFADIASTVAFLVGPTCRNLTGETLQVDGGLSKIWP